MARSTPRFFATALAAVALLSGSVSAEAPGRATQSQQDKVKLDPTLIRYGKASDFDPAKGHKVGTVRSTDVYNEIPAYQTIIKEKVPEGSARWIQLMREATEVYRAALEKAAGTEYTLIVEEGGISGYTTSNLTQTIIKSLK
ncbi:MAG: hypothetical protein EYC70_11710 [Planctomycetota bacterium]|nr:MAG: hypothetical protein EYC70_11710 [Planctomycetota bacterium]